jgi:hypothetical protein
VDNLVAEARRDLRGEGFDPDRAVLELELRSVNDVVRATGSDPGDLIGELDGEVSFARLTARYPLPRLEAPSPSASGAAQPSGSRISGYGDDGTLPSFTEAAVVGTSIDGPLLVDGGSYTWLVTSGWTLHTDAHGDASLTRK